MTAQGLGACLVVALITLCAVSACTAAAPALPGDPDVVVKEWTFDTGTEGWVAEHNLTPLVAEGGILRTQATGDDAFMGVGVQGIHTGDVTHLQCRMRSTEPGSCQVYFATSDSPNPADHEVPQFSCPGDNVFRWFDVRLAGGRGWSGDLSMLRLDPVNGPGISAKIEIDTIRFIRKAPRVGVARFAADKPWGRPGTMVTLRLWVVDLRGGVLPGLRAELEGQTGQASRVLGPGPDGKGLSAEWRVALPDEAVQRYRVRVLCGETLVAVADTEVIAFDPAGLPTLSREPRVSPWAESRGLTIQSERVALDLIRGREGDCAGVVRVRQGETDTWQIAGMTSPMVTLAYQDGRTSVFAHPRLRDIRTSGSEAALAWEVPGGMGPVSQALRPATGSPTIRVRTELHADSDLGILRFGGPTVLAGEGSLGERAQTALFPGVEFLEAGQNSSSTGAVGRVGYRPAPPASWITVPLMAAGGGDVVAGLMWDALQRWDGTEQLPQAEFASPNFLDAQPNLLMSVFVPGCPRWTEPNQRAAATPYELAAGATISLEERLFGLGTPDITQAVPLWYAEYGLPKPPPMTKGLAETHNDLIRGWAETCYYPEADAFVNHWRMGQTPYAAPSLKAEILVHALVTGEKAWLERCRIAPDAKLHQILGPLMGTVKPGPPPASLGEQREDGTWAYHCTDAVRKTCEEFTGGERHSLGEEGSTCVGLCAVQAVAVLSHALQTGNTESERAGLRALEAMSRFRVPRGSQTWEVHKDIPDIYGAALATDCFRMGWQLTGERRYLDEALYWARSGLPFLYAYSVPGTGPGATCTVPGDPRTPGADPFEGSHPAGDVYQDPNRQVTPWGSIPVFGTSFYVVSWYGVLVQWCGLVWADSVYALLEQVDDPVLRAAADGVVASGCNQTFDRSPVVGLLPDSWNLAANMINPPFIGPIRVQAPLERRLSWVNGVDTHTEVARDGDLRAHVTSRGPLSDLALSRGRLRWTERYIAGESCDTVVLGLPKRMAPAAVRVGGRDVPAIAPGGESDAAEGWEYVADTGLLFVRARHTGAEARVEVSY